MKRLLRIIFFGFTVMELYRLGRHFKNKRDYLSLFITKWCKYKIVTSYGCHISFSAKIANDCKFIHPTAIVIGDGVIIHSGCQIYQCVTIGAARQSEDRSVRYPTINKNCTIFSGAKIIGNVNVGENSIVGANSVVNKDIPCYSTAVGIPARIINTIVKNNYPSEEFHQS